jgi:hypothetical protein
MSKVKTSVLIIGIVFTFIMAAICTYFGLVELGVIETEQYLHPLTVNILPGTYEYDGQTHSAVGYAVEGNYLSDGDHVVAKYKETSAEVGKHEANADVYILDVNGNDVTNKYDLTVVPSYVTITPRLITVKLDPAEKEYDGTPLTTKSFHISNNSLVPGHVIVPNYTTSVTDVNVGEEKVYGTMVAEIYDTAGKNLTSNYVISYDNTQAELVITKKPVVITTLSLSKE